ncbi:MAG: efflux transporter outer membrane subunit [Pseudomonadota bacterium]|nr:efflux transporter outer membrane subunit [Pseudomonadota bacterium]
MNLRAVATVALSISIISGGCSLAPRYTPPTVASPASFAAVNEWQLAEPADALPRGPWWERYRDPTLDKLEGRLENASPDLAGAVARYAEARALAVEANAGLFPSLASSALATRNRQSDHRPLRSSSQPSEYLDYAIGASASYEIDLWGRVHNIATIGKVNAQASAADLEAVRLSLEAELANDYLTLRGLDVEIDLLKNTVQAYQRALDLARSRYEGGIASGLDVARAETQLDSAAAQLTDTAARRALFEHAIARLVGEAAPGFTVSTEPALPAVPEVPLGLPSTLVERRPDVAAAERRTAAANAGIGVARAAYFPRLTIGASSSFESTAIAGLLGAPNNLWAFGPAMALTLFDAGARHAEVYRAKNVLVETTERYRATVLSAFQEVADNLALLELLKEESVQQRRATTAAQRAVALATNRYTEGAVNYLEVVVAQTAALQADRALLSLQVRQLTASVGLIRGLGGGWSIADLPSAIAAVTLVPTRAAVSPTSP